MTPPVDRLSATYRAPLAQKTRWRSALRVNLAIALLVWIVWLTFGARQAIDRLFVDWKVALTMVFGSLVGGGTSEGGGAIAFPIFTKLLHIAPMDARNFSLAIQSIGMGAASLSILYLRIPIERRALFYSGAPGVLGVAFGAYFVAPTIPPVFVRTSFTVLVSSIGVALLLVNREKSVLPNENMALFGASEKSILMAGGFLGGVVSALVGTGENSVIFMVLVLLFRVNEKIVTPTTVILMTLVTIPGFLLHVFVLRDFAPTLMGYWLAAVPVVAVGAPMGAFICSQMNRHVMVLLLLFLISLEFLRTVLLVPMSRPLLWVSFATLVVCGSTTSGLLRWGSPEDMLGEIPAMLPTLPMPTLLFHGERDVLPAAFAEHAASLIPNASVVKLDAGHFIPLDRPTGIADCLRSFFAENCAKLALPLKARKLGRRSARPRNVIAELPGLNEQCSLATIS